MAKLRSVVMPSLHSLLARLRRDPDPVRLARQGVQLGRNVSLGRQVYISSVAPGLVAIGDETVIGANAFILSHDNSMKRRIGYTRVAPVTIGQRVYIGANAVILPGVRVGDESIIGAGSVVTSDVPTGSVVAGNPGRILESTAEFVSRHASRLEAAARYEHPNEIRGAGYVR